VRFVETLNEGAREVSAFRDGDGKSSFQKFIRFLGHSLILHWAAKVVEIGEQIR